MNQWIDPVMDWHGPRVFLPNGVSMAVVWNVVTTMAIVVIDVTYANV